MATSHIRGNQIEHQGQWVYSDNKASILIERPCVRCGEMPTEKGYDACLGYLEGVTSACCGHGVSVAIIKGG